ncbi:hypothetical protein ACLOAV_006992 [Pseudogymnoascus australis]
MENIDFDWLDGDYALNHRTPEFLTSDSPRASLAAEQVDQPSGEHALPLLRLSGWKSDKQYDNNPKLAINWQEVDNHREGLSDLFTKGRKIAFSMEFVYKEVTSDSTTAKGKKKKKSATKQGPHCWSDEPGNHHRLLSGQLEDIVRHVKDNMKEGKTEEDVDIDIEIPSSILKNVSDNSGKRIADGLTNCRRCKTRVSAYSVVHRV